jgi:hypothetical protein
LWRELRDSLGLAGQPCFRASAVLLPAGFGIALRCVSDASSVADGLGRGVVLKMHVAVVCWSLQTVVVREVLVSLPSGAGVVRCEDGSVLVTDDVRGGDGSSVRDGDRFHPVKAPVDGGGCVVGGLLPPGAVSVQAVDDRGDHVPAVVAGGAYVAVLAQPDDGSEPIVCCRDGTGRPVRRPLPAQYPAAPVSDAQEPCPACGAIDYEEYRPFEAWRGGEVRPDGSVVPGWVVCCRVCGHEEEEGSVIRAPARTSVAETRRPRAEMIARARAMRRDHMWRAVAPGVLTQGFAIYGAGDWPARLSRCGAEDNGRLTHVTVQHYQTEEPDPSTGEQPRLAITTSPGRAVSART